MHFMQETTTLRLSLEGYHESLTVHEEGIYLERYRTSYPHLQLVSRLDQPIPDDADVFNRRIFYHKDVVIQGQRIVPSGGAEYAPHSIIHHRYGTQWFAGEVQCICTHVQPISGLNEPLRHHFFGVRWFSPSRDAATELWDG